MPNKSLDAFADRLADYLLTRNTPWHDPSTMREAVHATLKLVTGEARSDLLALMGIAITSEPHWNAPDEKETSSGGNSEAPDPEAVRVSDVGVRAEH